MFLLRLFHSRLRLVDGLLSASPLILPVRFLPGFFVLATLTFALVRLRCLPVRSLVRLRGNFPRPSRWFFRGPLSPILAKVLGQFGVLAERPVGSHRTLSTTPGFAMVAAMTSGSVLSFAAPWWKRLLSAPHASSAAFIDGAAMACSKKPSDVW